MDIEISIVSPTTWSGNVEVRIPTGFTVDTNAIPAASPGERFPVGQAVFVDDSASTRYLGTVVYYTTTSVRIWSTGGADVWAPVAGKPVAGQNGADAIHLTFSVPIAEWAGNGTVNLGPGAQVEYATNTNGTNTATDTSSFFNGIPTATNIPNGATGTIYTRTVRFQYAYQIGDMLQLWVDQGAGNWVPYEYRLGAPSSQLSRDYGVRISPTVGSTDVTVSFAAGGWAMNGAAYGDAGSAWSSLAASSWKWMLVKSKPSSPVGYGKANSTEFGLVAPRRGQQTLTVTSSLTGWVTTRAVGIYYQDQDGNHRLKFNIAGSFSSTTYTTSTTTISGVTFKNGNLQAVMGFTTGGSPGAMLQSYTNSNASTIVLLTASGTTITGLCLSGDVELESRPSWA